MRSVSLLLVVLPLTVTAQISSKTTSEIQGLGKKMEAAYMKKDVAFFENLLSAKFEYSRPGMPKVNEAGMIKNLKTNFKELEYRRVRVALKNITQSGGIVSCLRDLEVSAQELGTRKPPFSQRATSRLTFERGKKGWELTKQVVIAVNGGRPSSRVQIAGATRPAK